MVDNDGSYDYSDIRSVRFDLDGEGDLIVYPNPAVTEVYVNLSSINQETGPATMYLLDNTGKIVKTETLSTSDEIKVDIINLPSGFYHMSVKHDGKTYNEKVIKIN